MKKVNRSFVKIITMILVVSMFIPITAHAAMPETVAPLASEYLMEYGGYICAMGDGDLEIWYEVYGTRTCADIGVLNVILYESTDNVNWSWVKSYICEDYDTMLGHNNHLHVSHVDYEGVPGRYYKAYVCVWAGPEDYGDARYFWTPVERCI